MAERRKTSPFPGMDPYLEKYWPDVHGPLCTYARDHLNERLVDRGLVASVDLRLIVESDVGGRQFVPDVRVTDPGNGSYGGGGGNGTATMAAPATRLAPLVLDAPQPQRLIEVRDPGDGGRLLTVVEFVSPSNKRAGDGRVQYEAKQRECVDGGVNLVEVDLTRAGRRRLAAEVYAGEAAIPDAYRTTFNACVFRADGRRFAVYPMPLDLPLPDVPVPLRPGESEESLPLQSLVARAYRNGLFAGRIDYATPPIPPLSEADAALAESR